MRLAGPSEASAKRYHRNVLVVKNVYLSVFPLPVQARCSFLQLLLGVRLEQVVMYALCVVPVLWEQSQAVCLEEEMSSMSH